MHHKVENYDELFSGLYYHLLQKILRRVLFITVGLFRIIKCLN